MYYLYWYHLPEHTDITKEGYVGITNNLQTRAAGHKHAAFTKKLPYRFYCAMRKYGDRLVRDIICKGSEEEIVTKEALLRPAEYIGWNTAIGGGLPPDITGRTHSEETKQKIGNAHRGVPKGPSVFKGRDDRYSQETKDLIGSYHKGKTISEAHKQAITEKMSGANSPRSSWEYFQHKDDPSVVHVCVSQKDAATLIGSPYSSVRAQIQRYNKEGLSNYNRKGWKYCPPGKPTE